MGGWGKKFIDGKNLHADSSEVERGLKSWSKTECRLSSAYVSFGYTLEMSGVGDYWQSETYEMSGSATRPTLIKFRIERKITVSDIAYSMTSTIHGTTLHIGPKPVYPQARSMPPGSVGKWLVLEYDLVTKSIRTYFSSEKI
jgi:hypothetical protein